MCLADLSRYHLTPRETEVVLAVAAGLELKEMARALGIGYHTAKMHVRNAKGKMGARNQLEIAILAHGGVPQSQHQARETPPPVERHIEQAPGWQTERYSHRK